MPRIEYVSKNFNSTLDSQNKRVVSAHQVIKDGPRNLAVHRVHGSDYRRLLDEGMIR